VALSVVQNSVRTPLHIHHTDFYRRVSHPARGGAVAAGNSSPLGIDGVIVSQIEYPIIKAAGEWDPPGGWVDAKIDLESGEHAI
jgi:hypothetical protein